MRYDIPKLTPGIFTELTCICQRPVVGQKLLFERLLYSFYVHCIPSMVNVPKFQTHLFSNKMLVFGAGIHKFLVRTANREDPDQTASSEAV